ELPNQASMTLTTRAALFLALLAAGCVDTSDAPVPTSSDELPIAASRMSLTTAENVPLAFDVGDADDAGMTFTASRPQHGTLSGNGPTFTYTPIVNWNGSDVIDVTV